MFLLFLNLSPYSKPISLKKICRMAATPCNKSDSVFRTVLYAMAAEKCVNCVHYAWPQPEEKVNRCSKCKVVSYCSTQCQVEHWHKVGRRNSLEEYVQFISVVLNP